MATDDSDIDFCVQLYCSWDHRIPNVLNLLNDQVHRLPADPLFKNVLHDNIVCDYHTYFESLAADICSAVLLAQENTTVEQQQ